MFTTVDHEYVRGIFARVPVIPSTAVRKFCEAISPGVSLVHVPIRPVTGAVAGECFKNVKAMFERFGGSLLLGWSVVEWPGVFAEAEFHAVWQSPDGLVDITPQELDGGTGLFLRDPRATYNFESPQRVPNKKTALSELPEALAYLAAVDAFHVARERVLNVPIGRAEEARVMGLMSDIVNAKGHLLLALANTTRPNGPCVCGSGAKFKKCCYEAFG